MRNSAPGRGQPEAATVREDAADRPRRSGPREGATSTTSVPPSAGCPRSMRTTGRDRRGSGVPAHVAGAGGAPPAGARGRPTGGRPPSFTPENGLGSAAPETRVDVSEVVATALSLLPPGRSRTPGPATGRCQRARRGLRSGLVTPQVLAIVLAGGEGKRLMPLTADRAKPAVPFGGHVPDGRLRAVQPGQRRLPQAGRADAVQEPLAGPAHLQDLAAVDAARQLRGPRPGAAAPRPALVRGLGGRHPPEPEPHRRRAPDPRRGVRGRPHLPDGPGADGRGPPGVRGGRHGRRHPAAPLPRRPVRGHRGGRGQRPHHGVPREAPGRGGPAGRARRGVRVDGQLRLHHRGAGGRRPRRRRGREQQPRHGRQHHPDARRARRGARLRLPRQRRARDDGALARLLARRRHPRQLLRGPHGPHLASTRAFTCPTAPGRSSPTRRPGRRRARCTARPAGSAPPSRACCPPGRSSPGRR